MLLSMLAGGVVAAPLAACVICYVPARPMGIAVAVLLLMTNARQLVGWAGFNVGSMERCRVHCRDRTRRLCGTFRCRTWPESSGVRA